MSLENVGFTDSRSEFDEVEDPKSGKAVVFNPDHSREKTRARLAVGLSILLAVVLILILSATLFASYPASDARDLLGLVVAPLVGLVGAATGFYYGGQQK